MQYTSYRKNRLNFLMLFLLSTVIIFLYFITAETGIIPGNDVIDARKSSYIASEERQLTIEGTIVDRNEDIITIGREKEKAAECLYLSYSPIVGYNSPIYGVSGLRDTYSDLLFYGGKDGYGAEIHLTTDNQLQNLCYDLIGENVGSISILNNNTGEILALASRQDSSIEYDVNDIEEKMETYRSIENFFYNRALFAQDPAGSVFKIITSAALIENNLADYTFNDTGVYEQIHNAGNTVYGVLDLQTALITSANTYFASAGNELGGSVLYLKGKDFLLGETIDLDFATLQSNYDLEYYHSSLVAQTAFGQGKTKVSPLQLAMILSSIVNQGSMMKPYIIEKIVDDKKIIYEADQEVLSQTMNPQNTSELLFYLNKVAVNYGFSQDLYGTIYAKTGTASVAFGDDYNHIYLVFANSDITGIISFDQAYHNSSDLVPLAKEILNYMGEYKKWKEH